MTVRHDPDRPPRSLQLVTALYLILFALAFGLIVLAVIHHRIIQRFEALESDQAAAQLARAEVFIKQKSETLRRSTWDYAYWTELEAFFRRPDPKFIASNFASVSLQALGIDQAWLIAENHTLIVSARADGAAPADPSQDTAHVAAFAQAGFLQPFPEPLQTPIGFLLLDGRPLLAASAPVLKSDRSGPSPGWIIFGRWLDGTWIDALQKALQLRVDLDWPGGSAGAGQLPDTSPTRSSSLPLAPTIALHLTWPATLAAQGAQTTRELAAALIILGTAATVYLLLILRVTIFARLQRLAEAVRTLNPAELQSDQPLVKGNDEIGHLGRVLKSAMRRLTESEHSLAVRDAKHQAVLNQLPEGIFLTTESSWTFIEANPACARLLNRPPDSLIPHARLPDCLERTVPAWSDIRSVLTRKGTATFQAWIPLSENAERKLEVHLARVTVGDETLVCGVLEDLTERDRLQEAVRRAEMAETVGALAGGVAHDFNNLLTVLVGGIELLRTDPALSPNALETIDTMDQAARSASDLTRKLLFYGRRSSVQLAPVEIPRLFESLRGVIRRVVPENIDLEISCESGLPLLLADARSIEQVLLNLALNARDAMPKGGRLSIAAASASDSNGHQRICLTVTDTGCGIPPEIQLRMFEPFFTTKDVGQGSGLGLSMVDGIVRQHGGEIRVESTVGRGTSFHLLLPAAQSPAAPPESPSLASPEPRPASILLVEDEPGIRSLLASMLTRSGLRCHAVANGREALDWFNRTQHHPEVLVSDVVMPGDISGYDLAACLIAKAPDIKIIMISGYNQEMFGQSESVSPNWDPTRFRFLEKPFRAHTLIQEIRSLLSTP